LLYACGEATDSSRPNDPQMPAATGGGGGMTGDGPAEPDGGQGGEEPIQNPVPGGSGGMASGGGGQGGSPIVGGNGGMGPGGTPNVGDLRLEEVDPPKEPCPANAPRPATGERPNFLWLVSEDNSPFIGAYGDKQAKTPNIDQLAKEGVLFKNAFAPFPVCAPTRFSIFTGIEATLAAGSQDMRNVLEDVLPDTVRGWAEDLRNAGYYTVTRGTKTDYNHKDMEQRAATAWNALGDTAHYSNRPAGSPFFAFFPVGATHESALHAAQVPVTDPASLTLPPYHPDVPEFRRDWARVYDRMGGLDKAVKNVLDQLKADGLYENTIIFYFSDHGGIMPRSKRYVYDSGTHVPLIVRAPSRWCHILPAPAGDSTDRLVSLADLGPTLLKVAGLPLPSHFSGKPFLDIKHSEQRDFVVLARRRMDEQMDLVRSIRTRKWQYVYNFQPFRPAVSFVDYMYKSESSKAWDSLFRAGQLNDVQAMWFKPRSGRQLYNVEDDPHQINSLHASPAHQEIALKLDGMLRGWMKEHVDTAFAPEALDETVTYATRKDTAKYPLDRLMDLAFAGTEQNPAHLELLRAALKDPHAMVRYWAAVGLTSLGAQAAPAKQELITALGDAQAIVQIAAAEALLAQGVTAESRAKLEDRIVNVQNHATEKLYAGQAYVTFESLLAATPKSVFQEALMKDSNYYSGFRLNYLLTR
jgi:arylsulfatase A-like enzyme